MYLDIYQFFNNGKFIFKPNEYNGLNRVISINGTYKIKGDTLFLIPYFTKEVVGGSPIRSESTTLSDTWELINGHIKTFVCKKISQPVIIKIDTSGNTIFLDNRKFYRIVKN
jgi:hypothetical protein